MTAWMRAARFGLASWLIPFAISFAVFPLKQRNAPLFETLMALVLVVTAGVLFARYFHGRAAAPAEALWVGLLWTAINLALDYPMFHFGPMKMAPSVYWSEIGLAYLAFPAFGFWAARMARA